MLNVKLVLAETAVAVLDAFCDCTTTENGSPYVGFVPPLTEVTASLVGPAAAIVTVAEALFEPVSPLLLPLIVNEPVAAI